MKKAPAPKLSTWSTIDECIAWLQAETGVAWSLPAILERGAMPSVWFDWAPEIRELLGDRTEGFNAPFVFSGDTNRMAVDRTAKLTMTRLPDGRLVRFTPGRDVAIGDVRFAREDIERLSAQSTPAHPCADNWKVRVQIQATELCKRQRARGEDAPPIRPIDDSCVPLPAAEAVEWAHQASATGLESTIAASEVSAHPPGPKAPTGPILR